MGQKIHEWFDVHNDEHLNAWRHLEKNGSWPDAFIPHDVEFDTGWQFAIAMKLVSEYLKFIDGLQGNEQVVLSNVQQDLASKIAAIVLKGIKDAKLAKAKKLHEYVYVSCSNVQNDKIFHEVSCLITEAESLQNTIDSLKNATII